MAALEAELKSLRGELSDVRRQADGAQEAQQRAMEEAEARARAQEELAAAARQAREPCSCRRRSFHARGSVLIKTVPSGAGLAGGGPHGAAA